MTKRLSTNLAGSSQIAPAFWLDPKNGVAYPIVVQTPQYRTDSLSMLDNPRSPGRVRRPIRSSARLGTLHAETTGAVVSHYGMQPVIDVYATTQGRDLGARRGRHHAVIKATRARPAQGRNGHAARPGRRR